MSPGFSMPMVEMTPHGGSKDMSMGYGSQLPPKSRDVCPHRGAQRHALHCHARDETSPMMRPVKPQVLDLMSLENLNA